MTGMGRSSRAAYRAFGAYSASGAALLLAAVSWQALWRVERPTSKLAEMEFGTFWEFLGNLPRAVEGLSVPQTPEFILTVLPTVYLWRNIGLTLVVSGFGAAMGAAAWGILRVGRFRSPP